MGDVVDKHFSRIVARRRSVRSFSNAPLSGALFNDLVQIAQGERGTSGKRTAPSAHSLYPIRLFATVGQVDGLSTGLYSIDPDCGKAYCKSSQDLRRFLREAALEDQPWLEHAPLVISLYTDLEKVNSAFASQSPFGCRGERYAYIEAGTIAQNMSLQAACMDVGSVLVAGFDDGKTARVHDTSLHPILHMCFGKESGERTL